ncbi:MAG: MobA/MobL family protein [Clostridia bacterium]|nr:MobA/MobL family protein [Clostridia bacterium]
MPATGRQALPAPIPSATHHDSAAALKKGEDSIPCPHFSITITSRGKNQSAMAGASYYLGQKLYSEYDHEWKYPHSDPKRVRYTEVLLPPNAPPEYANRQTLWNAVDAAEKSRTAQTARRFTIALPKELTFEQNLALIRDYCAKQFVDKGMICDLYYHDSGNGNPHVHLMLTMRAMDENGRWLPKTKTAYVLDENGQRIRGTNGKWLRERMDTVDWNDQKYAEIWRHEWEVAQNNALEASGRTERIDMRSYERQGITDLEPQIHLGPEAAALERKGIPTTRGRRNREIKHVNALIRGLQKTIAALGEWLRNIRETLLQHEIITNPDNFNLGEVLLSYLELRKADREFWDHRAQTKASLKDLQAILNAISFLKERELDTVHSLGEYLSRTDAHMNELRKEVRGKEQRIRDIDALLNADKTVHDLQPVYSEYSYIRWKSAKERFATAHADELEQYMKAQRLLHKFGLSHPIDRKTLRAEKTRLEQEIDALRPEVDAVQAVLDELKTVRYWVRKVIPDALPGRAENGKSSLYETMETAQNTKEQLELLDRIAEQVSVPCQETVPFEICRQHNTVL